MVTYIKQKHIAHINSNTLQGNKNRNTINKKQPKNGKTHKQHKAIWWDRESAGRKIGSGLHLQGKVKSD